MTGMARAAVRTEREGPDSPGRKRRVGLTAWWQRIHSELERRGYEGGLPALAAHPTTPEVTQHE